MKTIIAGSRDLIPPMAMIERAVTKSGFVITEVVSGCCRGVDTSGIAWAESKSLSVRRFPVTPDEWSVLGPAACPIRNGHMAEYADALIAIPGGGNGTWDMISKMRSKGKPVFVYGTVSDRG